MFTNLLSAFTSVLRPMANLNLALLDVTNFFSGILRSIAGLLDKFLGLFR